MPTVPRRYCKWVGIVYACRHNETDHISRQDRNGREVCRGDCTMTRANTKIRDSREICYDCQLAMSARTSHHPHNRH